MTPADDANDPLGNGEVLDSAVLEELGLPEQFPPGTVALPCDTHLALSFLFESDDSFRSKHGHGLSPSFKSEFNLLAQVADCIVTSPRFLCSDQVDPRILPRSIIPEMEYWNPIVPQDQSLIIRKALQSLDATTQRLEAEEHPHAGWYRMEAFSHVAPTWMLLLLCDATGASVKIPPWDVPYFRLFLRVFEKELRPPRESTAHLLVREIQNARESLFRGIAEDFYFEYWDFRVPVFLSLGLREAATGRPSSILTVLRQMRMEEEACAFRAWCASSDELFDTPVKWAEAIREGQELLRKLSHRLASHDDSASIQVSPLPPFLQLSIPGSWHRRIRGKYRSRQKHLQFMQSVLSKTCDISRIADDVVRVFGLRKTVTADVQRSIRQGDTSEGGGPFFETEFLKEKQEGG